MVKGRAKRKIYFTGGRLLSLINKVIPKKKNKILIFCRGELCDNSETLFHYLKDQGYQKKYEIVCAVSKPEDYGNYAGTNIRFVNLMGSIWQILTSGYIFYHGEILAIMPGNGQVSVNYWHGTPLKKINKMLDKLGDYQYDFFTYLTAASQMFVPVMAEAFGCEKSRVLIAGHPRNDDLFVKEDEIHKLGIDRKHYKKIFAWLPTYRESRDSLIKDTSPHFSQNAGIPLFHTKDRFQELNLYLKEKDSLLLIKLHPAQKMENLAFEDLSNIKLLSNTILVNKGVGLYRLLKDTDALITDYSSVYFDYLLLDRPEAFVVEDMKEYESHRGFVVENPLSFMPGPKLASRKDFYAFLESCICEMDDYQEMRSVINERVNDFKGPGNCARLLEKVHIHR